MNDSPEASGCRDFLKRILCAFFWRKNPKAEVHFSTLLATVALAVLFPFYATAIAYILKIMVPSGRSIYKMVSALVLLLLFAGVPKALFLWRFFPECLRRRRTRPVLLTLASAAMAAACLAIFCLNMPWHLVFQWAFFFMVLLWTLAINAMQPEPRSGKWIWLAPAMVVVLLVIPEMLLPASRRRIETQFEALCRTCDFDTSWLLPGAAAGDDPLAPYLNLPDEADAKFYSPNSVLGRGKSMSLRIPPTPEETVRYEAFITAHAQTIAACDRATDIEVPPTLKMDRDEPLPSILQGMRMSSINQLRMFFATANDDETVFLDANRRLKNLIAAGRSSPRSINFSDFFDHHRMQAS